MLKHTSWRTVFFGKGWASATKDAPPASGHDLAVRVSVSGPEPGYIATALMYIVMARTVLEDKGDLGFKGGVFTPGALAGSGGTALVTKLITRLRAVGIRFEVDEPLKPIVPKPPRDDSKRPAWQTALNALALVGWGGVLGSLLLDWPAVSLAPDTPLYKATLGLEALCVFEVAQIVVGATRGNLTLGVTLHTIRVLILLKAMPVMPLSLLAKLILLVWAVTEVCRYPMFLTASPLARKMRYLAPVVTFPLGAATEGYAAFLALPSLVATTSPFVRVLVALIIPVNVFGGLASYPGVLKRAAGALRARQGPPSERARLLDKNSD